ncbi:MAG: tagG [Clostridiales bacterium]|jgi:lipopolysaccharide transport system permease protein/teichoic acid transport system permease protein|nr:tagG [Clostridiales bacterium]
MVSYFKEFIYFVLDIYKSKKIILELTKQDFRSRYLGSYLGILWAFIQPTITILIFWFVFQVGFKSRPVDDYPFILWLICGMIPWFFFSEGLQSATNSVMDYSYLVKKVVFRVSSLPIIKILSALFVHLFFIAFMFFMFSIYGYKPTIYSLQVIYYLVATIILVLGLSWITSSLVVFLKDVGQIVAMILQFGFWLTPIFWSLQMMPEKYHFIIKLNPMYYIVNGYRNTFIYQKWFWEDLRLTILFWSINLLLFVFGAIVFRKLRPHFADVL